MIKSLKFLLPDQPVLCPILKGPFQGSKIYLNPRNSLRKILGIYEQQLNDWVKEVLPSRVTVFDVGANDGYFTYGCAKVINSCQRKGYIVAFDPAMNEQPNLKKPANLPLYSNIEFEFISKYVGSISNENTITLSQVYQDRSFLKDQPSLIKVDVEGAELEVLRGADTLLEKPHHWVVEVHGEQLLEPVIEFFTNSKRSVSIYEDKPHWLIGAEARSIKNYWVTTKLI